MEIRRSDHGAHARWWTSRGWFPGQCWACSTSRCWTRLYFIDTAPGRQLVAANRRGHGFQTPIRAACARFAPWSTGRPPIEHARAGRLGVVVFAANAGRAPPHALDEAPLHRHRARSAAAAGKRRDHSFRTPCRAARARFVNLRSGRPPTEHVRAGRLGVVVSTSRRCTRLFFTDNVPGRRLRLRTNVIEAFESRSARPARASPRRSGSPPTEHTRAGRLGVVVFAANAGRAPPHAVGRGSSSPTPHQVGGCGCETA